MTRYKITERNHAVAIDLTEVNDHQEHLLAAFDECRQGNCSCPTDEYQKVGAMDVVPSEDAIEIHLQAKPGKAFDKNELTTCLEHTIEKADRQ